MIFRATLCMRKNRGDINRMLGFQDIKNLGQPNNPGGKNQKL